MHLIHYTSIGGVLYLPLESGECSISRTPLSPRATPATTGDWIEQHIQSLGTKKCKQREGKIDYDWPESEEDKLES